MTEGDDPPEAPADGPNGTTRPASGRDAAALRRTLLVAGVAVVLAVLVAAVFTLVLTRTGAGPGVIRLVRVKAFLSTFASVVLVALVANYVSLYRELPNQFTGSLLVFTVALLLYALSSNPLVWVLVRRAGAPLAVNIGGFVFLPDLFAAIAVVVLYYQSNR
jgi:hypothetical protein